MKHILILITLILFSPVIHAQVGINNIDPKASLDITATNQASPSNTDGLLIPRIDDFPASNPAAAQQGMMVYLTTTSGGNPPGFYYWDNGSTTWTSVVGGTVQKINDLSDGKSDSGGSYDGSSVFLGVNAGANDDSTNNGNVGVGFEALKSNTTGSENTAYGYKSLETNSTGTANTAVGFLSLYFNTTGSSNTASGYHSLYSNTTGHNNTATGLRSLYSNTTGLANTTYGYQSLYANTIGGSNNALGWRALYSNTTGNYNSALGSNSLDSNTTGNYNTALGNGSGGNNITGSSNVFIGYLSGLNETGSNKLYIENSSANSSTALIYGEFDTNILRINGKLQIGNPSGTGYSFPTTDGTTNQVITTNGSGQLLFTDASGDADWYESGGTPPNSISDNIYTYGFVGIKNTTPDVELDIIGKTEIIDISGANGYPLKVTRDASTTGAAIFAENTSTYNLRSYSAIETANSLTDVTTEINKFENGTGRKSGLIVSGTNTFGNHGVIVDFNTTSTANHSSENPAVLANITYNGGGAGTVYGFKAEIDGSGAAAKYGFHTAIPSSSGGAQYGLYSNVTSSSGYAGYFLGRVSIGTTSANKYIFPSSRGANGQIMQTDGGGNISWASSSSVGTDDQNISGSGLSGTDLTIGIESGSSEVIDLSSLQDGTGTDDQNITSATLTGSNLVIGIENGAGATVDLSALQDADWFESGSTPPNSINDNIYTNGNVGIGTTAVSNAALHISKNSSSSNPQLNIKESQANDGARINFTNSVESTNLWTLYARSDNTTASNYFNIYNTVGGNILTIKGDGRVGINDNSPTYALELPNSTTVTVGQARANAWVTYSDSRIKKEQQKIKYGLKDLLKIQPKSYIQYASEFKNNSLSLTPNTGHKEIGFIAQDLFKIIPEATFKPTNENEDLWSVNYEKIIPVTVQAIKELNNKVELLEIENKKLKQQLSKYEQLEARLSALESKTNRTATDLVVIK